MDDISRERLARLSALVALDEINVLVNPKAAVREARGRVTKLLAVLNDIELALRDDAYLKAMIAPQSPIRFEDMRGKEAIRIRKALEILSNWNLD